MIINSGKKTWGITEDKNEVLQISNHEQASTKLVFRARMNNEAVFNVAKEDTCKSCFIGQLECFLLP